jgi:hypothetical protein
MSPRTGFLVRKIDWPLSDNEWEGSRILAFEKARLYAVEPRGSNLWREIEFVSAQLEWSNQDHGSDDQSAGAIGR